MKLRERLRKTFKRLREIVNLCSAFVVTYTMAPSTIVLCTFLGKKGAARMAAHCGRWWSRWLLWSCGIHVDVKGSDLVPWQQGPFLILSNHQSHLDSVVIMPAVPVPYFTTPAQTLRSIPLVGRAFSYAAIYVERRSHEQAIADLSTGVRYAIVENKASVVIFPEGTRSRDGKLGQFKKGPFHAALDVKVPIVPIAIKGTFDLLPAHRKGIGSGDVTLRFGSPILVKPDSTVESLREEARSAVEKLISENDSE
jgi:1-acyl-sn-glycerol-3-phosphate acyltransferase